MKTSRIILTLGVAALLAGCSSTPVVFDPVGPAPPRQDALTPKGYLQVYTETDTVPDGDNTYYYPHADYSVYSTNGAFVMRVKNASFRRDETPAIATLPVGTYHLRAPFVGIPVVIKRSRTTVVHLDGQWRPDRPRDEIKDEDLVKTPSGRVIGWRAK
ncbi:MAG: hypothetical protein L0Y58_01195 [Verrucomicrobia subdivision 3 bacterium]|nr:hypothetical protein [Limisphaerales bacterium]